MNSQDKVSDNRNTHKSYVIEQETIRIAEEEARDRVNVTIGRRE